MAEIEGPSKRPKGSIGTVKQPLARAQQQTRDMSLEPDVVCDDKTSTIGGTQIDAVVISDDDESSPMPEDMLPAELVAAPAAPRHPSTALPKTPAAMRSSPLIMTKGFVEGDDTELLDQTLQSSRKANIVGFGKAGPRNQGILASRTPKPRLGRSSMRPSKPHHAVHATPYGTSSTKVTGKSLPPARSSNVARDFGDAMGGLWTKSKESEGFPGFAPAQQHDDFPNIDELDGQVDDPPFQPKPKPTTAIVHAVDEHFLPIVDASPPTRLPAPNGVPAKKQPQVLEAIFEQSMVLEGNDVMEDQEMEVGAR
jgi:hypothetical protein